MPSSPVASPPLSLGFIGLGVMGAPMAGHLARAGHSLVLLDADPAAASGLAASLVAAGGRAQAVATPRAVAAHSDIILTMLPNGGVVQQVALGQPGADDGLLHGLRPGALLLDCSSAEPWLTQATAAALAGRGGRMVDAPVSGAAWGAAEANLVFMVGGDNADVARVRPLLDLMGRAVFHLGAAGQRPCDEVHQQPDHRADLQRHRRGPGDRQALRAGPGGDGGRAEREHRPELADGSSISASAS